MGAAALMGNWSVTPFLMIDWKAFGIREVINLSMWGKEDN